MLNFDWLSGLSITAAKGVLLVLLLGIAFLVSRLEQAYVMEEAPRCAWWMNLKWWTYGLLLLLAAVYYVF